MRTKARILFLLVVLTRLVFAGDAAAQTRVLVVNGVAVPIADEFIGALKQGLGANVDVAVVPMEARAGSYSAARVIVPLGTAAVEAVMADKPPAPVVASLVPRIFFERSLRQETAGATALFLGQSFARQLALIRKAFPSARRIAVLTGPDSVQSISYLEVAARDAGFSLAIERGDGSRLHGALRQLATTAELLLVLPDPQVFNASSIQGVLLETYRAQMPVIGISPAYGRAGAVLSLSVSPVQLGSETARLVREVLGGHLPEPRYSEVAEVYVNRQVARSLGLELPTDEALLSAGRSVP